MYRRLLHKPLEGKQSFFLFGPRGTGKTWWLRSALPQGLFIDLLDQRTFFHLVKDPHALEEMIPPGISEWIVIDEVQKIPALLNEVHRLIEAKGYRFVLTGSSARTLRQKGVNLLAGRALSYAMFPLTAVELGGDFQLERSLKVGHLPFAYTSAEDPQEYLAAYVSTYLREEVMQEGVARHAGSFARFLEKASFSQGSLLNVSQVAKEAQIERKTVEDYFQILEDLLLASRLPIFTKWAKRKIVSHPKFYYFDVGVYRALRPLGPFDAPEEAEGAALETLVFQELSAINSYYRLHYELFFWRTADGKEVDFVLYGPRGIIAIEVKRAQKLDGGDEKGLRAFQSDYPMAKLYLFYGGKTRLYKEGIEVIPLSEALLELPKILESSGEASS